MLHAWNLRYEYAFTIGEGSKAFSEATGRGYSSVQRSNNTLLDMDVRYILLSQVSILSLSLRMFERSGKYMVKAVTAARYRTP